MKRILSFAGWGVALLAIWGVLVSPSQNPANVEPSATASFSGSSQNESSVSDQINIDEASQSVEDEQTVAEEPADVEDDSALSNNNYYTNTDGNEVHSPAYTDDNSVPDGATAQCVDGTYSFSQNRRGTCSHHGGVAAWL